MRWVQKASSNGQTLSSVTRLRRAIPASSPRQIVTTCMLGSVRLLFIPSFLRFTHSATQLFGSACPWANRCLTVLHMKGLQNAVGVTVVHPTWARTRPSDPADVHCGWAFHDSATGAAVSSSTGEGSFVIGGCAPDPINGAAFVRDLYEMVTTPLFWNPKSFASLLTSAYISSAGRRYVEKVHGARAVGHQA